MRPEAQASIGAGVSRLPQPEQAQSSNLHGSRVEQVPGTGLREYPPQEHEQGSQPPLREQDLCGTRNKSATYEIAGLNQ